jgi:eukaryotic-like serine/threonine-protein kinase
MQANQSTTVPQAVVRYEQHLSTASVGSIWIGRLLNGNDAGRMVLVRRISKHWMSNKDAEWVLSAAAAYSKVRHPSLVKLLGILEQDDDLVSISEHLEGVRLVDLQRSVFDEGVPIPATVAVRVVLDAAKATWKAHHLAAEVGIFPTERLFMPEGVLLASFGGTLLTETGVLSALGRCVMPRTVPDLLGQLAPEELGAKNCQSGSPEVFSLGVVLWELLANRWLFSRESDSRTHQELLLSTIPRLDQVERFGMPVPEAIVKLVRKATDRDPGQRYASVNEFVHALEQLPAHFIATEHQVAEVLRQRVAALLNASKGGESNRALSGTFAEVRSAQPSAPPPSATSHDWDRPTFAQFSLVSRPPFLGSVVPITSMTAPPRQPAPIETAARSSVPRLRKRRTGLLPVILTMATVGILVVTFRGLPQAPRPVSSPAPAAAVAERPPNASPKTAALDTRAHHESERSRLARDSAQTPTTTLPSMPQVPPETNTGHATALTKSKAAVNRVRVRKTKPADSSPPTPAGSLTETGTETNIDPQWGI